MADPVHPDASCSWFKLLGVGVAVYLAYVFAKRRRR